MNPPARYVLAGPGGHYRRAYLDRDAAMRASKRMAEQNPGQHWCVYELVSYAVATTEVDTVMEVLQ